MGSFVWAILRKQHLDPSASAAVAGANVMVARCVLLIILCASRGINWVLDQPQGSLLERHPAMQWLFTLLQVWRKSIKMGDFQAPTQKATWLYSGECPTSNTKNGMLLFRQPGFKTSSVDGMGSTFGKLCGLSNLEGLIRTNVALKTRWYLRRLSVVCHGAKTGLTSFGYFLIDSHPFKIN